MNRRLRLIRDDVRRLRRSPQQRHVLVNVAGTVMGQGAVVVSGVLAARLLGVTDRGYLALFVIVGSVVLQIGTLGIPMSLAYYTARGYDAYSLLRELRPVFAGLALGLPLVAFAALLIGLQGASGGALFAALLSIMCIPFRMVVAVAVGTSQGLERYVEHNTLKLISPVLYSLALVIGALLFSRLNLLAVTGIWVATQVVAAGYASVLLARSRSASSRTRLDPAASRRGLLAFGARGVLGGNSPVDAYRLDQAVVGFALSPYALGLYVSAAAFTNFPRLYVSAVGTVGYPRISRGHGEARLPSIISWFLAVTMLGTIATIIPLMIFADPLLPLFFGDAFRPGIPVMRVLLVAAFFACIRRALSDVANGLGRPSWASQSELISWIVLAIGAVTLAPLAGVVGVAWALAGSGAIGGAYLGLRVWVAVRALRMPTGSSAQ